MSQYEYVQQSLKKLCYECPYNGTDNCNKTNCLVGLSENIFQLAEEKSIRAIKGGEKLIPIYDVKNYREELIADSIAEVCKLCAECRENHNEQCIISIARRSLESAILAERIVYHGSVFMYIMDVAKQNPQLAEIIKVKYMEKQA